MKLDNERLSGAGTPATGRSAEADKAERLNRFRPADTGPAGSNDQVHLSSLAGGIVKAGEADTATRAARVQALAKLYQAGRYTVDPSKVSQKVVTAWLNNTNAPEK